MKKLLTLFLLILFTLPLVSAQVADDPLYEKTLQEIGKHKQTLTEVIDEARATRVRNSTDDLIDTGIENLRSFRAKVLQECALYQQKATTVASTQEITNRVSRCRTEALSTYDEMREYFRLTMLQDSSTKKFSFFEERYMTLNNTLNELLELLLSLRGNLTKVQQGIDYKVKNNFVQ